jgi:hypothetical protein
VTGAKICFAGEGANELGSRAREIMYQDDSEPGVLQALTRKVQPDGWHVAHALVWRRVPKLAVRGPMPAEVRNVLGATLDAKDRDCAALVFCRDSDGDGDRVADIERGLKEAAEIFPSVRVVGGCAQHRLEAWILALVGVHRSETHRHPEVQLAQHGVAPKDTRAMVAAVVAADLTRVPPDATSLRIWMERAEQHLPAVVETSAPTPD